MALKLSLFEGGLTLIGSSVGIFTSPSLSLRAEEELISNQYIHLLQPTK